MTPKKPEHEKLKTGRPRAMTPEMKKEVIDYINIGGSIRQAAGLVGIGDNTLRQEAEKDPEFARGLAKANAECQRRHIIGMQKSHNKDWRMHLQFLARKFPDDWAENKNVTVSKNAKPAPVQEVLVETREEASRFRDLTQPHSNRQNSYALACNDPLPHYTVTLL